jgi:hypothetical protein
MTFSLDPSTLEGEGNMLLRNVGKHYASDKASNSERPEPSVKFSW